MNRQWVAAPAAALLTLAGFAACGQWEESRLAACAQRAGTLAALPLLAGGPAEAPANPPYAGCDVDRRTAYAGRQYRTTAAPAGVVSFYRDAAERDAWQVVAAPPSPGPDRAGLCLRRTLGDDAVYAAVWFPATGTVEVHVAESPESGTRC